MKKIAPMGTTKRDIKPSGEAAFDAEKLSRAPAVNRAISILRVLADAPDRLGVNAIARALGIVPSTCHHILRALEEEGFVVLDPTEKRYAIGLGLVTLARDSLNIGTPMRLVQRELDDVATAFGTTCIATQLEPNDRMVLVAIARGDSPFGIHFEIGRRFPAFVSATGRCLAAHSGLSRAELKRKFHPLIWDNPPVFDEWLKQIEQSRRDEVAEDRGQYVRGFTIVAAPVLEDGRMTRSLVCVTATDQLTSGRLSELRIRLREGARRLTTVATRTTKDVSK
jgi:DNA-binding IclR family transcriptional regulator